MEINSYKDLIVWKKSIILAKNIYKLTEDFPKEEIFGLTSQMRRAAVSIPSNIAEGRERGGKREFLYFLYISLGSTAELKTQIEISKTLSFGEKLNYNETEELLIEIEKMLNVLISKLKK